MDLDDCDSKMGEKFKNKELFKGHWLYDYIVPIYNNPDIEKTYNEMGIDTTAKKGKKQKEGGYINIFPRNNGKDGLNIDSIQELSDMAKKCKKTTSNIDVYIDDCLRVCKEQHNV